MKAILRWVKCMIVGHKSLECLSDGSKCWCSRCGLRII